MLESQSWIKYASSDYRMDLQNFSRAVGQFSCGFRIHTSQPETFRLMIEEAVPQSRRKKFVMVLFLECLLQAGVHSYDPENFDEYIRLCGHSIFIESEGLQGMHHPQFVLLAIDSWNETDLQDLDRCLRTLIGLWMEAYEIRLEDSRSMKIMEGLVDDKDLGFSFWSTLPIGVIETYRTALRRSIPSAEDVIQAA
jgi:hypothetical protein